MIYYENSFGYLVNPGTVVDTKWVRAAQQFVDLSLQLCPSITSAYLRGSACTGEAIDLIADLDLIFVTEGNAAEEDIAGIRAAKQNLLGEHRYITRVDTRMISRHDLLLPGKHHHAKFLIKVTARPLHGEDLTPLLPCYSASLETARLLYGRLHERIEKSMAATWGGPFPSGSDAVMARHCIRAMYTLGMDGTKEFTRDLRLCLARAQALFPKLHREMETLRKCALMYQCDKRDYHLALSAASVLFCEEFSTT